MGLGTPTLYLSFVFSGYIGEETGKKLPEQNVRQWRPHSVNHRQESSCFQAVLFILIAEVLAKRLLLNPDTIGECEEYGDEDH